MTKLSVNINKLATLRNARGGNNPDVLKMALDIIRYGADGITVHPRPDGRHIRYEDVYAIHQAIDVEFNIEGYPDSSFLALVQEIKPAQCTLVPDAPDVLTSNAGWLIEAHFDLLKNTITALHQKNIRTSLFIDPYTLTANEIACLAKTGTDRVELYTEAYARAYGTVNEAEVTAVYQRAAEAIKNQGIALNAGHDLTLDNLSAFISAIPFIDEVSIGHALICDALIYGMQDTISRYLACLNKGS